MRLEGDGAGPGGELRTGRMEGCDALSLTPTDRLKRTQTATECFRIVYRRILCALRVITTKRKVANANCKETTLKRGGGEVAGVRIPLQVRFFFTTNRRRCGR